MKEVAGTDFQLNGFGSNGSDPVVNVGDFPESGTPNVPHQVSHEFPDESKELSLCERLRDAVLTDCIVCHAIRIQLLLAALIIVEVFI